MRTPETHKNDRPLLTHGLVVVGARAVPHRRKRASRCVAALERKSVRVALDHSRHKLGGKGRVVEVLLFRASPQTILQVSL